ncbi:MAG: helix-turn-helix domain-containing protein [Spirochaetaceae bacterium]|nr:helix-turn-helix domain-containing protein [Spirochaetaceae bacterium]
MKNYRKKEKLSQMQLAEACNTAPAYIGQIEIGNRFPSIEMISHIAEALKVEPYRLFMEENAKEDEEMTLFLEKMPRRIRKELITRLIAGLQSGVEAALEP